MKKYIGEILMAVGIIMTMVLAVCIINNNNTMWELLIGFTLCYIPLMPGTWIVSGKLKEKCKPLYIYMRVTGILVSIALVGLFITFLFNL